MKKFTVILLAVLICLVSVSCGKSDSSSASSATSSTTTASSTAATSTVTTAAVTTPAPVTTAVSEAAPAETATVQETAASEPAAVQAAEETKVLEPASIKVWYSISGTNGQFFESQVKAFNELNPQITIELTYSGSYADSATKISASKLAGNAPDMAVTSASQLYTGEDGNFSIELDAQDADFNIEDIQSGILEYAKFKGRLAAVPFSISTQVVYYNKDLVKKAGYDLDANPPKTWDEFLEVAKAIQSTCVKGTYGFDTSDAKWLVKSMLYQNGNNIVEMDADGNITPVFNNESGIEVATFWQKMIQEKVMPISQHDNAENKFLMGKLVFCAATSNRISKWTNSANFEVGAIEMPYFRQQCVALGGSTATILATDQAKHEACWALLKYLLNTENQAAYALTSGYLPIRKSSLELDSVKNQISGSQPYAVASSQLEYAWAYTHFGEMGSMDTYLNAALDDIENGTMPDRAFSEAYENLLGDFTKK